MLAGFDAPYIKGATGYLDTDYRAKANAAIALLEDHDIVYVHVEALMKPLTTEIRKKR